LDSPTSVTLFSKEARLRKAAKENDHQAVKKLIDKADPNALTREKRTALHAAAAGNAVETIRILITKCDPNQRGNEEHTSQFVSFDRSPHHLPKYIYIIN